MTLVRKTMHFDAPIERVFELAIDFKRYPEWNVNYHEPPEVLGTGPLGIGTKIHARMQILGQKTEGTSEVLTFDPPRLIEMKGTSIEGGTLRALYRFTSIGSGTDCELEIEYEPTKGILGQFADKLFIERTVDRDLQHSLDNFKAVVEVKQPVLV